MSITYKRTMNLTYLDSKLKDYNFNEFLETLDTHGLNMSNGYDVSPVGKYDKVTKSTISRVTQDGRLMFESEYQYLSRTIVDTMKENDWKDVKLEEINADTIVTVYREPKGSRINYENMITADTLKFTGNLDNPVCYIKGHRITYGVPESEEIILVANIMNGVTGLILNFIIEWETARVRKAATIKERMVDTVLNDIGLIQHIFETAFTAASLTTAEGVTLEIAEQPEMDCYFEHITESKSECAPDIVAQTREARLKFSQTNLDDYVGDSQ